MPAGTGYGRGKGRNKDAVKRSKIDNAEKFSTDTAKLRATSPKNLSDRLKTLNAQRQYNRSKKK